MALLTFFTRGDEQFGSGHLHRTLWLAELLASQPSLEGQVAIFCLDTPFAHQHFAGSSFAPRFSSAPVADWLDQRANTHSVQRGICILDWLDNQPEDVQALRATGSRVVLLDDYGPAQTEADLVINSLLSPLRCEPEQRGRALVLGGTDYLALAPAVTRLRGVADELNRSLAAGPAQPDRFSLEGSEADLPGRVRSILVSSGGSGNAAVAELVLAALHALDFAGVVTVMPDVLKPDSLQQEGQLQVARRRAGQDFHEILAAADLAVLAGGLTLYEAAFLGVPALVLPLVAHQAATASKLARAGCCLLASPSVLDWQQGIGERDSAVSALASQLSELLANPWLRAGLSRNASALMDGRGLQRCAKAILETALP